MENNEVSMDEFKTQVLLLHSEQSTLDNLSSGFSDEYTVHCATSGSEALNTLVETPINVIITAQELPGMSGLDALREAKKRSPDTIGILLAGSADSGLEALVGDKEVFQIVRGNITNETVLKLVEQATQTIRLMALAESANDTAANPDETATQHIVMETSENGSPIVSDGTGQLPTLDPKKVSAATSVGSQAVDVLVLTNDQEFLETIKESSRGMHQVHYTNTLAQADEAIRKHKIGVAVVDSAMVGEKIERLTQHLRKNSPRLVSIVAGRREDGEMLMDLINRGKVYRFLLKPVSPGRARLAVEASVKHHLEAPEAAFVVPGGAPGLVPVRAPAFTATPKTQPKPIARATRRTDADAAIETSVATPVPESANEKITKDASDDHDTEADQALGGSSRENMGSNLKTTLTNVFGEENERFSETVSGLLETNVMLASGNTPADGFAAEDPISASPFDSTSGGSSLNNPKIIGFGVAAIALVAAGIFWFSSQGDDPEQSTTSISQTVDVATRDADDNTDVTTDSEPQDSIDVGALIEQARAAQAAGQIVDPADNNAIELFAAAVAAAPNDSSLAIELDAALEQALGMAETAMLERRLDDASNALHRVHTFAQDHARLPFLNAQLLQMQTRAYLDEARAATRESRFEDAAFSITAARNLEMADTTAIDLIDRELSAALAAQEMGDVLAKANDRLASGNLLTPANNNARYYFGLVLVNDANNTAARQGLSIIASKLALQARSEIDNGNFSAAERLLANARTADASNADIAAASGLLADTRATIGRQNRQAAAAAASKAEAVRQADIDRAQEEERLRLAALIPVNTAQIPVLDQAISGDSETENAAAVVSERAPDAKATSAGSSLLVNAPNELVAVSSLTRKRYVAPRYPRVAERRGLSGWVDVVFTVGSDGKTSNIVAQKSAPGDTFVNAAVKAVEKWEFEPIIENGATVEKRAGVRLLFAIE
jgi:TonB family protein